MEVLPQPSRHSLRSLAVRMMQRALRMNVPQLMLVACTIAIGVAFIYGSGQQSGGGFATKWLKQCLYVILGLGLMVGTSLIDYRSYGKYAWQIFATTLFGLALVLFVGKEINGARSWIGIGPLTIQPSEFAKIGSIVILSWLASRPSLEMSYFWHAVLVAGVGAGIPGGLILLQPDVGSTLTLMPIALCILYLSGLKVRWLVYLALIILPLLPLTWHKGFRQHHRDRVWVFTYNLMPQQMRDRYEPPNVTSEGWNAHQSLLAVGSGGLWGKGYMQGTQNALGFLPRNVAPTDFIFSVIAEETGFVGSMVLLVLQWLIVLTCVYVAVVAADPFGRNLAIGFAALLTTHSYVNIGMTIGLVPIIGIPLPFVSSGGSFMLTLLICVGVVQSVYCRRPKYEDRLSLAQ